MVQLPLTRAKILIGQHKDVQTIVNYIYAPCEVFFYLFFWFLYVFFCFFLSLSFCAFLHYFFRVPCYHLHNKQTNKYRGNRWIETGLASVEPLRAVSVWDAL